jgi:hypothetical protein
VEGKLVDEEVFNVLSNLSIIFSKIIKQKPGQYYDLNERMRQLQK